MSCYIEIYVRHDNQFIPFGSWSRNSVVYQMFDEVNAAPWEAIRPVTFDLINEVESNWKENIDNWKEHIKKINQRIDLATKMSDVPFAERVEKIEEYQEDLAESKDSLAECEFAMNYLETLKLASTEIKERLEWQEKYPDDYGTKVITGIEDTLFYIGMEVGAPTVEDIVE